MKIFFVVVVRKTLVSKQQVGREVPGDSSSSSVSRKIKFRRSVAAIKSRSVRLARIQLIARRALGPFMSIKDCYHA